MIWSPSIATAYPKYDHVVSSFGSSSSASRFTSAFTPVAVNWCFMDQVDK